MKTEDRALTAEELIELLSAQDGKLKVKLGDKWVTRIKYRNVAGKPHIELLLN